MLHKHEGFAENNIERTSVPWSTVPHLPLLPPVSHFRPRPRSSGKVSRGLLHQIYWGHSIDTSPWRGIHWSPAYAFRIPVACSQGKGPWESKMFWIILHKIFDVGTDFLIEFIIYLFVQTSLKSYCEVYILMWRWINIHGTDNVHWTDETNYLSCPRGSPFGDDEKPAILTWRECHERMK